MTSAALPRSLPVRLVSARSWAPVVSLGIYLGLAVVLFFSALSRPDSVWIGDNGDPHLFIWYLGWVPHALASEPNPLVTTAMQAPSGASLMWNTSVIAPALALWPVTAAFGPIVSYNVASTGAIVLSAWCTFWAIRRIVGSDVGATVAGLVYGFSPYMLGQAPGHLHMTLALFPPIALLLLHAVLVEGRRPALIGALLGVASAIQLLTGEEILATTALVAAVGVAVLAAMYPHAIAAGARKLALMLGAALAVFLALAAYPLWFQFMGPLRVSGALQPADIFVSDLLAFVAPLNRMAFSPSALTAISNGFTGNGAENGAYLGLPLLVLVSGLAALRWRRPLVRWAALFAAAMALLSLGPRLHIAGQTTPIRLPWVFLHRLPVLDNILPGRLTLFLWLAVGLLLAELVAHPPAGRRALAGVAIAIAMVPLLPSWPFITTEGQIPAYFKSDGDASRLPAGAMVLIAPYSNGGSSVAMLWQAAADYRFRMPEGEAFNPNAPNLDPAPSRLGQILVALDHGDNVTISAADLAESRRELSALGVTAVIAGPSAGQGRIVSYLTAVLGRPPTQSGGVDVWNL